jgi:hypothetical protein
MSLFEIINRVTSQLSGITQIDDLLVSSLYLITIFCCSQVTAQDVRKESPLLFK